MESKNCRPVFHDYGFTDRLLSWSLDHILNPNLFKDKVAKIPESFQSAEEYFRSFVFPLLEETRAQLHSGMETISRAPFAKVIAFKESKPYGKQLYDVQVDHWGSSRTRGKESYKTLPGDILVLADAKPQTASDLQGEGRMWTLLSVTKITGDENENGNGPTCFKVRAPKDNQIDDEKIKSLFMIFLTNITPNRRIWISLHMSRNSKIIKKVLCKDTMVEENCELCSVHDEGILDEKFDPSLSSTLNDSQVKAVFACLRRVCCDHKATIELIWGPPGTGKTKTVSILLFALLRMKCRTLVCAPTNVAITEVVSRVVKLVKESSETDSRRVALSCPLGDVLLFGNNERLKVGREIENIYLDYRIERLAECFGPVTGWRPCITSMIEFLEDCVSQYHSFLENELTKDSENNNEKAMKDKVRKNKTKGCKGESKSFLRFVRDRFSNMASSLKNCIFVFCTHIPKNFILENDFQNMVALTSLLDAFKTLLFQDNVGSEELEELFSRSVVEDFSESTVDGKSLLHDMRRKCHSVSKIILGSLCALDIPKVVNIKSLKDFCFKKASLIFCTASSSHLLHSMAMEPLSFLVIDEAAQLKESESTMPMQLPGIKHAVLIGDEQQLPATVESTVSDAAGFGRSLFERLSSLGHSKHLLNIQYRMHPSISLFANSYFYQNKILDGPNVKQKGYKKQYLPGKMFGSYSFINIIGGREEFDDVGHSRRNMVEVSVVMKILQKLHKAWTTSKQNLSIGIVSPYTAQVFAIQEKLGRKYEKVDGFCVKVKSIDGFQGGEEDIIIISTVRSNSSGSIGFMSKLQRINVAVTRARHCLWILGNERTLTRSESVWENLVRDAKDRQCFFNADEDKDLAKAILEVKREFDELDELVNAESILFRSQRWKVVFSDKFLKCFKKLTSYRTKKSVINLLLKLSSGWRPNMRNIDSLCGRSLHILKKFKIDGLYVVCSTDIVKESHYIQVLKVWDILPSEDVQKLVKCLDNIFVNYTDDYIKRCKEKCLEGNLEVPKTWEASSDIVQYKNLANNEGGVDFDGECCFEKFYTLSAGMVSHLLSDREGRELDLTFEVTDEQMEIILFPRSTFILGQSGTGKTTILTMKLFQKEKLHHMLMEKCNEIESRTQAYNSQKSEVEEGTGEKKRAILRQLFVTINPKVCFAVKQHISHLKSSAFGGKFPAESSLFDINGIDDAAQIKDIPNSFVDVPPKSYPLVITFHKFLMMLDWTLGNSYFERFHGVRNHSDGHIQSSRPVALQTFISERKVNYDRFSSLYWPQFDKQMTKRLDSSGVFTEIIYYIKGGLQTVEVDGKLNREDYVQLSECRDSTLSRQKRETIYDIFQTYERMKMENGEFDLADLVIDLHRRLKVGKYEGDLIDFVYIDEVQDLSMSQIMLFKYICKNVEEGFVFSGDTAQTIAKGINFRFQDIRSLFYKKFVLEARSNGFDGTKEKEQLSEIFNLSQNFCTHAGVLKLAQSIIDIFYRFFPQSIDVLKPEYSLIHGEPPVLLESGNNENAILTIFGNTENVGWNTAGFGAEQVILVRDDCAQKKISSFVGKRALVLTISESKGLQFQDVLLYNFFGSSPLKSQWKVIYEYMKEQGLLDSTSERSFQSFNKAQNNILCAELKQLYVAITCTKQRFWICEDTTELSVPMFDYWKKKSLVQVKRLDDSFARAMQLASSPEEWRSQGITLFYEHNYEMATICFERAGDTYWERRSKATGLKAAADHMRSLNPEQAKVILREAAEIFEDIGKMDSAAICFSDLGEYERAGRIYLEKFGESDLERAGECFCLAGHYELAAEVFAKGNFFSECLAACSKGKLFDIGFQYIHCWKQKANKDGGLVGKKEINKIEQDFLESCALHYHELKDNTLMMKYVNAFHSMDMRHNFLKSLGCFDELLLLEKKSGNFVDDANTAKLRGELLLAVDLLQKAGSFEEASTLTLNYVFSNSLWSTGSKGWPLKQFRQKKDLLEKAKSLAKNKSNQFYEFVCSEADILSDEQRSLTILNYQFNASKRHQSIRGEILSVRKILDVHLHSNISKYEWNDELVLDLITYSEETIRKNQVSVETLVYFWNYWKDKIAHIFEYLVRLGTLDVNDYRVYGDFCLNYLGVWKPFSNPESIYLLLNSNAEWVRELDHKCAQTCGKLVSIDVHNLVSVAQQYWRSELLSIGLKVLDKLVVLHKLSFRTSLSVFCQIRSFTYIYEVAKFLIDFKFVYYRYHDAKSLQKYFELLPTHHFFDLIFPIDPRESLKENLISLRGTASFRSIIKEVICLYSGLKNKLCYGQIGSMVVMTLGSVKLNNDMYESIAKRFDGSTPWKDFVEGLSRNMGLESSQVSAPGEKSFESRNVSLIQKFHGALVDTYKANRKKEYDYISPSCFLYLIERLLIMVSFLQGYVLTTKSSFVDWLISQEGNTNSTSCSIINVQQALGDVLEFVVQIVRQFLYNEEAVTEWIKKTHKNVKQCHSLVVLRLVIIICLLHLNFGNCVDLLVDLLGRNSITKELPREFYDAFPQKRKRKHLTVNVIAEAFKKIANPLVIVSLGKKCSEFLCPDAIFVDMKVSKCKEDVVGILFPKIEASQGHVRDSKSKTLNLHREVLIPDGFDQGKISNPPSESASLPDQNLNINKGNLMISLEQFWKIFEALKSVDKGNDRKSNLPSIKVDVEKSIQILTAAMDRYSESQKGSFDSKDKSRLGEAASLLEELKQLFTLLDLSEPKLKSKIPKIREAYKKLQAKRPTMEAFMNQLFFGKLKAPEPGIMKNDNNSKTEETSNVDKMKALPANVASGIQGTSQETGRSKTKENTKEKDKKNGEAKAFRAPEPGLMRKNTNSKNEETGNVDKPKAFPVNIASVTEGTSQQETGKTKTKKNKKQKDQKNGEAKESKAQEPGMMTKNTNSKTEETGNVDKMKALPANIASGNQSTSQETGKSKTKKNKMQQGKKIWEVKELKAPEPGLMKENTNSKTGETSSVDKMKALSANIASGNRNTSQETGKNKTKIETKKQENKNIWKQKSLET